MTTLIHINLHPATLLAMIHSRLLPGRLVLPAVTATHFLARSVGENCTKPYPGGTRQLSLETDPVAVGEDIGAA